MSLFNGFQCSETLYPESFHSLLMTTGITRLQSENKVLTRNTCIAEPRKTIATSKITTQKKLDRTLGFLRSGILRVACLSRSWFIHATPPPHPPHPLGGITDEQ